MDNLKLFYENEKQRETVKLFMQEQLRELAADMAIEGESVTGIPETNRLITRMFDKLDEMYGRIEVITEHNSR